MFINLKKNENNGQDKATSTKDLIQSIREIVRLFADATIPII